MVTALIFIGAVLGIAGLIVGLVIHAKSNGPRIPSLDELKRAIQIVWVEQFNMPLADLPSIVWITGKQLNCHNGTGWLDKNGQCVAGETWADIKTCAIAVVPGEKIHETSFVHELTHYYLDLKGMPDPNHETQAWQPGGIVEQSNAALQRAGL